MIGLKSFNKNKEETGYINLFFHPNKRIFLDTIYCYNQYRSLNIASKLSEIVDYVLQNYPGYTIRGIRDFKFIAKRNIISSIIKIILAIVLSLTPLEIIGVWCAYLVYEILQRYMSKRRYCKLVEQE